jgi:hypothetical protein
VRTVLFPGSYDVIFLSSVVLGYIIEVGFLFINLFLLFLSFIAYPGFSVILVDCCGVVTRSSRR